MSRSFADALAAIDGVDGWLSADQAGRLYERASAVPAGGTIVEIGSFRGRSTIVLASAAAPGVTVVAIDPYAGTDRGPQEWRGRQAEAEQDLAAFTENVERAGVAEQVRQVRLPSSAALREVSGEVDLLYVDGAHRYGPCRADLAGWGARVAPGGVMLIHDAFSSVGVTLAILRTLALDARFRFAGRTRSLAEYRRPSAPGRGPARPGARAANAARQLAQLPWFARNLAIKLAVVSGLRPVAAWLGHRAGDPWPY